MSLGQIPKDVNDVIVELSFISKVNDGHKINVEKKDIISSNSWIWAGYRSMCGETREKTIKYIKSVVGRALELVRVSDSVIKKLLETHLTQASSGIISLMKTYKGDHMASSKIENILYNIYLSNIPIHPSWNPRFTIEKRSDISKIAGDKVGFALGDPHPHPHPVNSK